MSATTNGTTVSNITDIVVETELKGPDGTTNYGTVTTTIHRVAGSSAVTTTTVLTRSRMEQQDSSLSAAEAMEFAEDMLAHFGAVKTQLAGLS